MPFNFTSAGIQEEQNERINAEKKIAAGITMLCTKLKPKAADYNAQGIATIKITREQARELALTPYFPNELRNGITLHFYQPGYTHYPPINYMVQQKIKSLCNAATLLKDNPLSAATITSLQANLIKQLNAYTDKISKLLGAKEFDEKAQRIMEHYVGHTINELYAQLPANKKTKLSLLDYGKALNKESEKHRSDKTDTLTINEETQSFSFDALALFKGAKEKPYLQDRTPVTAHNKKNNRLANISMVFDGKFVDEQAEITSSALKHASLIDNKQLPKVTQIGKIRVPGLINACNRIEDIILAHAALRKHGRKAEDANKPLNIDLCYQLYTSTLDPTEAINFSHVALAMKLMNNLGEHERDDEQKEAEEAKGERSVKLNATTHIFNAGINRFAHYRLWKRGTQDRTNEETYTHFTNRLRAMQLPPSASTLLKTLHSQVVPKIEDTEQTLFSNLDAGENAFKNVTKDFQATRQAYNTASDDTSKKAEAKKILNILEKAKPIQEKIATLLDQTHEYHKKQWEKSKPSIEIKPADIDDLVNNAIDDEEKLMISALVYKKYMDDLYYSGEYHQPKFAVIFNMYATAFLTSIGMMPSIGCKSANDRTLVGNLFRVALYTSQHQDYRNEDEYEKLIDHMNKEFMTNSAIYNCILDTGGSTSKVDPDRYEYINKLDNLKYLAEYGQYAPHKLAEKLEKILPSYEKNEHILRITPGFLSGTSYRPHSLINKLDKIIQTLPGWKKNEADSTADCVHLVKVNGKTNQSGIKVKKDNTVSTDNDDIESLRTAFAIYSKGYAKESVFTITTTEKSVEQWKQLCRENGYMNATIIDDLDGKHPVNTPHPPSNHSPSSTPSS